MRPERLRWLLLFTVGSVLCALAGRAWHAHRQPADFWCYGEETHSFRAGDGSPRWLVVRTGIHLLDDAHGQFRVKAGLQNADAQMLGVLHRSAHFHYRWQNNQFQLTVEQGVDSDTNTLRPEAIEPLSMYAFQPDAIIGFRSWRLGPSVAVFDDGLGGIHLCQSEKPLALPGASPD